MAPFGRFLSIEAQIRTGWSWDQALSKASSSGSKGANGEAVANNAIPLRSGGGGRGERERCSCLARCILHSWFVVLLCFCFRFVWLLITIPTWGAATRICLISPSAWNLWISHYDTHKQMFLQDKQKISLPRVLLNRAIHFFLQLEYSSEIEALVSSSQQNFFFLIVARYLFLHSMKPVWRWRNEERVQQRRELIRLIVFIVSIWICWCLVSRSKGSA